MEEDRQTTEVRKTNVSGVVIVQRIIYYVGGVILALLFVRLLLQLFGASQASGFVDFVYGVSGVFVAPFYGIFGEPTFGTSHFETSTLVAIVIYGLITVGIAKLITITRPREEE